MSEEKGYRQLLVVSGAKQESCQAYANELTKNLKCLSLDEANTASNYLGVEFDAVVFNTFNKFNPNALGIVAGTIRAGGYLILIKPASWEKQSYFLERFTRLLNLSDGVSFLDINKQAQALSVPTHKKITGDYASNDQQQAVEAIIKVVNGHRRRPLVITADRGRGKSAALGIASAQLCKSGLSNIIVTAPSKKAAEVIFEQAKIRFPKAIIKFIAPDELQQSKPQAGLLLIDEAGAIPLPLLAELVEHYSRVVIATTLHGYEGSGRGFIHKFFKRLDALAPGWKHCQLQTPIRYPQNDPLENFIFKSLLLNAEPVRVDQTEELSFQDCKTKLIDKAELIKDESLLISIFGLLVNAHYQTKPSDLKLMLDDNSLSIYCLLTPQQQVVGVALMIREGGIETDLASQIYQGKRRVKGHLVAQALAANAGIEFSPCLMGERVSRLAIHPQLQNKGFGSYLLSTTSELITRCERNIRTDYISTSYGATTELINFWKKQGFKSVYLGMKRDASSGMNSVIMLKGVSDKGNKLVETAQLRFSKNYIQLLSEPFRDLNSELALSLLLDINTNNLPELTEAEKLELEAFAYHQRGYENTLYPIYNFVTKVLNKGQSTLSKIENNLLIVKILQKHSWGETKNKVGLAGKKQALQIVRQAIASLLASYNA